MRRLWIAGAVIWLMLAPAFAKAMGPSEMVRGLADEAIAILKTTEQKSPERGQRLENLFRDAMDIPFVGRFVMGRYWRTMSPAERDAAPP